MGSDLFFKLSRSVFRVIPSYLVFRELSKYVFRENKSFYEKIFFRVTGSILVQNLDHFGRDFCLGILTILTKIRQPHLQMDLTFFSDGVGRATA